MFKITNISFLYFTYFFFIVVAIAMSFAGIVALYAGNLLFIAILFTYLILKANYVFELFDERFLLLVVFTLGLISFFILRQVDVFTLLFYVKVILLYLLFKIGNFNRVQLVSFFNKTYLIYCTLSALFFFNIIPISLYQDWDHFTRYVTIGPVTYYLFSGLEGGPAFIDSYSGFILLINIFLNTQRNRRFYLFASSFFIIYSLKLTPLAGLGVGLICYPFIKNKAIALTVILLGNGVFLSVLYFLVHNIDPIQSAVSFWELMYVATHARSMIWEMQLNIMFQEFNTYNYIFGGYDSDLFSIPALQLWGEETGDFYDNPHNTYLLLFFRSPLLFIVYYLIMIYFLIRNFQRKEFIIALFILIISYTNVTILGLQNPVYLYFILYIISKPKHSHVESNEAIDYQSHSIEKPQV